MQTKKNRMPLYRLLIFSITIIVVSVAGYIASLYARGYRFNSTSGNLEANGLLVIKSDPDGAQIKIDGEFETLTNTSIRLKPKKYFVEVSKEGYISWSKEILIEKEVVTEVTAHLFNTAPSLSAITFSETTNVTPSNDFTRIAYIVPLEKGGGNVDKAGLWILEIFNLPLGFSREPRRITDGNLSENELVWSPDGREILLKSNLGSYLLNTSDFTPQTQRVNLLGTTEEQLIESWNTEQKRKLDSQIRKLPNAIIDVLERKTSQIQFSPDEDMVLYIASSSASIPSHLIPELPGSSSQKEERDIKVGRTYVYDIKEDRNFLITDTDKLTIEGGTSNDSERRLSWHPTSRNLILGDENGVTIMDYDGTNRKTVYSGAYSSPNVFPTLNLDRIIILTNLGSITNPPYLYFLSVK